MALNDALEKAKEKEAKGELPNDLAHIPRQYRRYKKLYKATLDSGLPLHSQWDHSIELVDGKLPRTYKIYNLNEKELKALREWLDEQLEKGYIRVSNSSAGYPVMFVPKKNGKLRLVIDYRQLNEITIKDRTPLPLISEIRDRLATAKWFTALDLKGAYNLIRIKKGDEWKTAFITRYGLFECLVMPFGLTNAPGTFQRMINEVLAQYIDRFVIVYLDDILIYSDTLEEHEQHVHQVLQTLQDANLLVEPEKCQFHVQEVNFLGHIITPGQIRMDPAKVAAIRDWELPETRKGIQSFLGLTNYYRRFIKNYSKIAAPLTDLTKLDEHEKKKKGKKQRRDKPIVHNKDSRAAFQALKDAVTSEPVLTMYDPKKPLIVETDASQFAIGGVLSQRDKEGRLRPIAFFSKKLNDTERRYSTYDQELMAIFTAFTEWRPYLLGNEHKITVYSDHKNLASLATKEMDISLRQEKYLRLMAKYDFEIIPCKGTENGRADALSRKEEYYEPIPKLRTQMFRETTEGHYELVPIDTLIVIEDGNPVLDKIKDEVNNWTPEQFPDDVTLTEGIPYRNNKVWVPESIQMEATKSVHEHQLHGHKGITKTLEQVRRYYAFSGMKKTVKKIVKQCVICAKTKTSKQKPYGKLQPLPVPEYPWESISFDHIVKLPLSKEPMTNMVCDSIFVIVDRLTKQAIFIAYKEQSTAEELGYTLLKYVVSKHGLPAEIISDRGTTFVSKYWQSLAARMGTNHKASTAYHPQTDGQTERVNQIVESYLRCYINFDQDDWVEYLPMAEFSYNSSVSESTKLTPFFANKGYEPQAYRMPRKGEEVQKAIIKAEDLKKLHDELRAQLEVVRERMKKYADIKRIEGPTLREGDMVYLLRHNRGEKQANIKTNRPSDKLDFKKVGPYKILKKVGEVNYILDLPAQPNKRGKPVHPNFHISALEKAIIDEETGELIRDEIVIEGEELEYEVDKIRSLKIDPENDELRYLVEWKGYDRSEDSWEPEKNFQNANTALKTFQNKVRKALRIRQEPIKEAPERPSKPKKTTRAHPPLRPEDLNPITPNRRLRKTKHHQPRS